MKHKWRMKEGDGGRKKKKQVREVSERQMKLNSRAVKRTRWCSERK